MSGELAILVCSHCGLATSWIRHSCRACGGRDLVPGLMSGRGTIWSATRVHRPAERDAPPYTIVLVLLDNGERLMARSEEDFAIGARVVARRDRHDVPPDLALEEG